MLLGAGFAVAADLGAVRADAWVLRAVLGAGAGTGDGSAPTATGGALATGGSAAGGGVAIDCPAP